jgi:hypothetical protein
MVNTSAGLAPVFPHVALEVIPSRFACRFKKIHHVSLRPCTSVRKQHRTMCRISIFVASRPVRKFRRNFRSRKSSKTVSLFVHQFHQLSTSESVSSARCACILPSSSASQALARRKRPLARWIIMRRRDEMRRQSLPCFHGVHRTFPTTRIDTLWIRNFIKVLGPRGCDDGKAKDLPKDTKTSFE